MDRRIVYTGAIPQDLDILQTQVNAMIALGWLTQAILGAGTWVDGLVCAPGSGVGIIIGPGQMFQSTVTDAVPFGSIPADGHDIVKQGILRDALSFDCPVPITAGHSVNYLIQARLLEVDGDSLVLPYYNPSNPAVSWSGHNNDGVAQNTTRKTVIDIRMVGGAAATTGTQITPAVDVGYTGLYVVTVAYGQSSVVPGNIVVHPTTPNSVSKALLTRLLAVDGVGSGLDADTIHGKLPQQMTIAGQVATDGSITNGSGFSVTHVSTGVYTITMNDPGEFSGIKPVIIVSSNHQAMVSVCGDFTSSATYAIVKGYKTTLSYTPPVDFATTDGIWAPVSTPMDVNFNFVIIRQDW